jgi:hypothetical protein
VREEEHPAPAKLLRLPVWRRWAAPALAVAAAVILLIGISVFQRASRQGPSLTSLSEEERQVVSHLDLLKDYDLLRNLDILDNLEISEHQEEVQNL